MTKFTPGPWYPGHLGDEGTCQCRTIVCEGLAGGIASVHVNNGIASISDGGNECPPKDEAVANMHLISSAPDMYEAGKKMMALVEHAQAILTEYLMPDGMSQADAMNMLLTLLDGPDQRESQGAMRAALSKAEGGT